MKVRCLIEFEHTGDFDEETFADDRRLKMASCKECLCFDVCNIAEVMGENYCCPDCKDRNRIVEVVRCKDCKMFCPYLSFCSDNCIGSFGYCQITHMNVSLDFYCGHGENKDGEQE